MPAEILEAIGGLDCPPVDGLRWTSPHQWHVTLRFLGRVGDVDPVRSALRAAVFEPTTATLGPSVGRFGQRILHVPVHGLEPIAAGVVAATAHLGKPPDDRPFRGHVTLARVAGKADVDLRPLTGAPIHGTWRVDSVCLMESHLGPAGARYEALDRFPAAS